MRHVKTEWQKRPVDLIFPEGYELKTRGKCPTCKQPINVEEFRDDLSWKEYEIAGMCQSCQDNVFEGPKADTEETPTVDERTFYNVLARLRDVRKWAVVNLDDPWAFRQALITIMSIDTTAALEAGIDPRALKQFDMAAGFRAQEFIETIPREGG